jgi:dihydroorotase-like cyclic amidohydrolase
LYDGLVEKADAFAEAYQGIYGIERNYPAAYTYNEEGLTIATELRSWIDANRRRITDRSELQNLIDETVSLLDAQIYKLKFLH